jgi:hypothetical protein
MLKLEQTQLERAMTIEIVALTRNLLSHLKNERLEQFAPWAKKEILNAERQIEQILLMR